MGSRLAGFAFVSAFVFTVFYTQSSHAEIIDSNINFLEKMTVQEIEMSKDLAAHRKTLKVQQMAKSGHTFDDLDPTFDVPHGSNFSKQNLRLASQPQ